MNDTTHITSVRIERTAWLLVAALFGLLFALVALNFGGTSAATATATPTRTPEMYARVSPTPGKAAAAMATLRALNGTALNVPTWTPGPVEINLNGKPHLIDFNADWCQPCVRMKPFLRKLKTEYGDQINFWDINTDNPSSDRLSRKYRANVLPMIIFLDADGKTVEKLLGYHDESQMEAAIRQVLGLD